MTDNTIVIIMVILLAVNSLCLGIGIGIMIGNNSSAEKISDLQKLANNYEALLGSLRDKYRKG